MNNSRSCLGLVTPFLVTTLVLAPIACTNDSADESSEESDTEALSTAKQLHVGPVEILGASKSRVLFAVQTETATEVHVASRTMKDRVIGTYPKTERLWVVTANGDHFLIPHGAAIGSETAYALVDLSASSPAVSEIIPGNAGARRPLLGSDGTVAYETNENAGRIA